MDKFVGSSEKNLREIFDNPPDIFDSFRIGERDNGDAIAKAALHVIGRSLSDVYKLPDCTQSRSHLIQFQFWMNLMPLLGPEEAVEEVATRGMQVSLETVWSTNCWPKWMELTH
jgi:hypothetical protein